MIFASIGSRLKEIENGDEKVNDSKIFLSRYKGELFPPARVAIHFTIRVRFYGLKETEITGPTARRSSDWTATASRLWNTLLTIPISLRVISISLERFVTFADVEKVVISWLQTLDTGFLRTAIQAWVTWWDKYLNASYDCVEVQRIPSASCL